MLPEYSTGTSTRCSVMTERGRMAVGWAGYPAGRVMYVYI